MNEQTQARHRSRIEGERLIAEYEASGLGRKAFCAARSISVNTLDYWRKRMKPRAVGAEFLELAPIARNEGALDVELELGGAMVLRIRRSV